MANITVNGKSVPTGTVTKGDPEWAEYLAVVKRAFPSYRKLSVFVCDFTYLPTEHGFATYWDGGSRTEFVILRDYGLTPERLPAVAPAPFGPGEVRVKLNHGDIVVACGIFQGKPATARVTFVQKGVE